MWGKGPPKDNAESWQDIQQFIAEYPDDDYWSKWKPMVRGVVSTLEARGLGPLFRIGQSYAPRSYLHAGSPPSYFRATRHFGFSPEGADSSRCVFLLESVV